MYSKENTLSELYKIPVEEWPKIWCSLNKWEIPDRLIHIKPPWWDEPDSKDKSDSMSEFLRPMMNEIMTKIGYKQLMREWNIERMNDDEFEEWWNTKFYNE